MANTVTEEARNQDAKLDMTPMIDCVFLLIIFFLCIEFRTLEAKLPAYLPKDSGAQKFDTPPIEKLSLKIVCTAPGEQKVRKKDLNGKPSSFYYVGHEVRYEVGPIKVGDSERLLKELERIYSDRTKWQRDDKTGELKPMPVVIEPGVDTVYGDVAVAVDAVRQAKFEDIQFGGGMGRGRTK